MLHRPALLALTLLMLGGCTEASRLATAAVADALAARTAQRAPSAPAAAPIGMDEVIGDGILVDDPGPEPTGGVLFVASSTGDPSRHDWTAVPVATFGPRGLERAGELSAADRRALGGLSYSLVSAGRVVGTARLVAPPASEYDYEDGAFATPAWTVGYGSEAMADLNAVAGLREVLVVSGPRRGRAETWRVPTAAERRSIGRAVGARTTDEAYVVDGGAAPGYAVVLRMEAGVDDGARYLLIADEREAGGYSLSVDRRPERVEFPETAEFVDAVDLDGDGLPEVVVAEMGEGVFGYSVYRRDPASGTWGRVVDMAGGGGC